MSSLEMVDYINAERKSKAEAEGLTFPCKKYRKLRHADFMKKVPRVLGEGCAKNFSHPQKNEQNGEEYPGYAFSKREACLMAMSYSYELQAQVFDHMTELEGNGAGELHDAIQHMENIVATAWKVSDEDSSDAGRRLQKRQVDLPVLKKAKKLVIDFKQLPLGLIGGGKKEVLS
ncbi:Rha family transcriptional regulator [Serratia sp. NPDC078593]|uniref:Rha family transcriptional regulator n=1 Tax=unclassified Serratia (in: enterobacteria) TaxID=2647522 RepID=UPI0037D791B2